MRRRTGLLGRSLVALATIAALAATTGTAPAQAWEGIHKIQHVIVVMQENRSFDEYFGTYPGAEGIPAGVCVPDPMTGKCVAPYHNPEDLNLGGPHAAKNAEGDIDGGKMDGFIAQSESGSRCTGTQPECSPCYDSKISGACIDVVGYHDARELPNYWTYAENFVLQDRMFSSSSSWSLPEHLFIVSGWSAKCAGENPLECTSTLMPVSPDVEPSVRYPWTDVTYLLHKAKVSWAYYMFEGSEPDCESDEALSCAPVKQGPRTPGIWNPLLNFTDVKEDGETEHIKSINNYFKDASAATCSLPKVSWVMPNGEVSEHPTSLVSKGEDYVTTVINAAMRSACWPSTAIFLSWDDWGGFYDHVPPPKVGESGYGLRVPGLAISPYARQGYIDHQTLSHDAYLKFIEDDFLAGQRLDPKTDGRPDSRPEAREEAAGLGNLEADFNFSQAPRPPLILPMLPAPGPASTSSTQTMTQSGSASGSTSPPAPLPLQLAASVQARQNMHIHRGRIYLVMTCNKPCSLYVHGRLSLVVHRRHVRLRSVRESLAASHATRVTIKLSAPTVSLVRRALKHHRTVKATIAVDASATDGTRSKYVVSVRLTYR